MIRKKVEGHILNFTKIKALSCLYSHVMTRSASKIPSLTSPSSDQTLEQYLASQPSIYIVAENLHPRDLSKTRSEEGYRILCAFLTVELANNYARKYAYGLKKWDQLPKGTAWSEEDLDLESSVEGIRQSTDDADGTHEYVVTWSHFTTIKVARWSVRDMAPTVDSNTDFFDRVDFAADGGAADSVYGESDAANSSDEDDDDVEMEVLRDELQGLDMDRRQKVGDLIGTNYRES
ncbi:hypothetical protein BJ170DRAFT_632767 [Xylariales sp. AK1849]|nr:hypothetical protein BJ170DRAFT_632767 [Xylariales sp. AK1849]